MLGFLICLLSLPGLQFVSDAPGELRVISTEAPEGAVLSLHRLKDEEAGPAIFAEVEKSNAGRTLTLIPSFQLSEGETYLAKLSINGQVINQTTYQVPLQKGKPLKVTRVYPGTKVVPANLLKFYIEFNQPVKEGRDIFDQIHIEDCATGKRIHAPWRRLELWSADSQRLTLWVHPGRVKQGVNLREELGPVLIPHREYELVIDDSVETPGGEKLGKSARYRFKTSPELRKRVDLSRWEMTPPTTSKGDLIFRTDRPLDPFLADRYITVEGCKGEVHSSDKNLTEFRFSPRQPWKGGLYQLIVDDYLEDLAGNTPARIFDTDLTEEIDEAPAVKSRSFEVSFE